MLQWCAKQKMTIFLSRKELSGAAQFTYEKHVTLHMECVPEKKEADANIPGCVAAKRIFPGWIVLRFHDLHRREVPVVPPCLFFRLFLI